MDRKTVDMAGDILEGIFPGCPIDIADLGAKARIAMTLPSRHKDALQAGEGPARDWCCQFVAEQGFMVVDGFFRETGHERAIHARAEKCIVAGRWQEARRYIAAYRDMVRGTAHKALLGRIVRRVKDGINPGLSVILMAGKDEDGWHHAAAEARLSSPMSFGARKTLPPLVGHHMCSMPSMEMALKDSIGGAIGSFAPDAEARYRGFPPVKEILRKIRADFDKAGAA